jgi:hypothetical protein
MNVPKGMKQERISIQVVSRKFHFCSIPTRNALNKNHINNAPCIGPISFTQYGLLKKYLSGTAISTNTISDIPSKKARSRKRPIWLVIKFFIIQILSVEKDQGIAINIKIKAMVLTPK